MEVEGKGKGKSSKTTPSQENTEQGFTQPQRPIGGPLNPINIVMDRAKPSILPATAVEKLIEIKKIIEDKGIKLAQVNVPFGSFEAIMLINEVTNLAYVLVYDDLDRSEGPILRYGAQIMREMSAKAPNAKITEMVLFIKEDYCNVSTMATNIIDALSDRATKTTTIFDWAAFQNIEGTKVPGVTLFVTNRDPIVRAGIRQLSSHSILARHEYGFAVYITNYDQIPKTDDGNGVDYSKMNLIGTCSGYTQMIADDSRPELKYFVVPTISEIHSAIPDPGVVTLIQQIAMERWILKGDWLLEFNNYSDNCRNPGRLILDAEGQMCKIDDATKRNTFLKSFIHETPWLAMDYIEGRHRIPGTHAFADSPSELNAFVSKFFNGAKIPDLVQHVFNKTTGYISGLKNIPGEGPWHDARNIDYMYEAISIRNPERIAFLRAPDVPPAVMNRYINENYPGQYRELFPLKTVLFNPAVMSSLRKAFEDANLDIVFSDDCEKVDYSAQASYLSHFGVTGTSSSPYAGIVSLSRDNKNEFGSTRLKFS